MFGLHRTETVDRVARLQTFNWGELAVLSVIRTAAAIWRVFGSSVYLIFPLVRGLTLFIRYVVCSGAVS